MRVPDHPALTINSGGPSQERRNEVSDELRDNRHE
jgi:hypothetical protein